MKRPLLSLLLLAMAIKAALGHTSNTATVRPSLTIYSTSALPIATSPSADKAVYLDWSDSSASILDSTIGQEPTTVLSSSASSSSSSTTAMTTHTIAVGATGFTFQPSNISAGVGDVIEFNFYPGNHSVVRSDFRYPCIPYESTGANRVGFFSGFEDTNVYSTDGPKYRVRVNNTDPIFYYCSAPSSCTQQHMIGVVNPNSTWTLAIQELFAANATFQLSPGDPFPSETAAPGPHTTSPGAIAGIVLGASLGLVLVTAVLFWYGRRRAWQYRRETLLCLGPRPEGGGGDGSIPYAVPSRRVSRHSSYDGSRLHTSSHGMAPPGAAAAVTGHSEGSGSPDGNSAGYALLHNGNTHLALPGSTPAPGQGHCHGHSHSRSHSSQGAFTPPPANANAHEYKYNNPGLDMADVSAYYRTQMQTPRLSQPPHRQVPTGVQPAVPYQAVPPPPPTMMMMGVPPTTQTYMQQMQQLQHMQTVHNAPQNGPFSPQSATAYGAMTTETSGLIPMYGPSPPVPESGGGGAGPGPTSSPERPMSPLNQHPVMFARPYGEPLNSLSAPLGPLPLEPTVTAIELPALRKSQMHKLQSSAGMQDSPTRGYWAEMDADNKV